MLLWLLLLLSLLLRPSLLSLLWHLWHLSLLSLFLWLMYLSLSLLYLSLWLLHWPPRRAGVWGSSSFPTKGGQSVAGFLVLVFALVLVACLGRGCWWWL